MSRHSRQDYHAYTQQAHQRWSPSPPMNRLSNPIDPRLAPRMGPTAQEIPTQAQSTSSMSQLHQAAVATPQTTTSTAATTQQSNSDIVQAIQAMNAQMTGQLSMMGTQLASLVSLTSRLIEISQLSSVSGTSTNPNGSEADSTRSQRHQGASNAAGGASRALSPQQTVAADTSLGARGGNRTQNGTLADGIALATSTLRPETRSGTFYNAAGYRGSADPSNAASSLERATFGSTLRGASPAAANPSTGQLASGGTTNGRSQQQSTAIDPSDSHKSRLPSPVFVDDDPTGIATDSLADAASQSSNNVARRQHIDNSGRSNEGDDNDSSPKKASESTLGDWKEWLDQTWRPSAADQHRTIKYRTMQSARRAHKDLTKRSMATLGRLPLKEFLEIKPEQYLNVRKTGRKVYSEWLFQEVRLAKQPEDRLTAAINRIEHEHPALGDCDDHWKAKQLLQQIIDNAIDEANLHRKKEARASNVAGTVGDTSQSTPRTDAGDVSRNRANTFRTDSVKKGPSATPSSVASTKITKVGIRRKADQAELEETPSRFRAPPPPNHTETALSSSRRLEDQSLHSHNSLSSGLGDSHARSAMADYSSYGNPDTSSMASATSDQTRGAVNNQQGWPGPAQNPAPNLFSQSSYTHHPAAPPPPQQQQHHQQQQQQHQPQPPPPQQQQQANQQAALSHQAYGNHHGNTHASHYLPSESHHHHHASSGTGLGSSSSSLLEPATHDGHRTHAHSHLSPLVNGGGVRLAANTASAQNAFAFDYRHHAG